MKEILAELKNVHGGTATVNFDTETKVASVDYHGGDFDGETDELGTFKSIKDARHSVIMTYGGEYDECFMYAADKKEYVEVHKYTDQYDNWMV
jgi:hypothetical protein